MKCEDVQRSVSDYLLEELSDTDRSAMEAHIRSCSSCHVEVKQLTSLWSAMSKLPRPEPSPLLRARFEATLAAYEHGRQRGLQESVWYQFKAMLVRIWPKQPVWQAAIATTCLIGGFAGGAFVTREGSSRTEISTLKGEVATMRQLVTLSLLQQQSPTDRLKGINWSIQVEQPTAEVPAALLQTVTNDENVNVRLAAVDALHNFALDERARRSLAHALLNQDSPLVQIALLDLLAQLHDPESARSLKRLADDPKLEPTVRQRAQAQLDKMRFQ